MRFVFASYVVSESFTHPVAWLHRIRAYSGLLEALAVRHEVISIEQIDYEGEYAQNGVRYLFIRQPKGGNRLPVRLHRLIRSLSPDIVMIQGLHFPLQVLQLRMALNKNTRVLLQHHAERPFAGPGRWAQRLADRFVDGYLFASRPMGMEWIKKGNLSRPEKIHEVMEVSSVFYPIDRRFARAKSGVTGSPVFLWVGRLNANKDPLTVLKAWLRFSLTFPSARLYMIYATEDLLTSVRALLDAHPAGLRVILKGQVPNADMSYWFNSADYIISGSYYEGSGAAVCEAMSCGCVPVLSDIDSFRTMTGGGRCGYLFQPGNEDDLFRVLTSLNGACREEKSRQALCFFRERLSFPAMARQLHGIATTLLPSAGETPQEAAGGYEPVDGSAALVASKN